MNPFRWLREQAYAAVMSGVNDALVDLDTKSDSPLSIEAIKVKFTDTLGLPEAASAAVNELLPIDKPAATKKKPAVS